MGSIVDGALGTDLTGKKAAASATASQERATESANETQKYMYDTTRSDLEPWRNAGTGALSQLQDPNLGQNWQQDPGYQFRMDEGMKAINNAASARGQGQSGATMKALTKYGQEYASNEYGKVYDRTFNRLSTLAGLGTGANNQQAASNANYGNQVAANYTNMGNAQAGAIIGANRQENALYGQAIGGAAMAFSDKRVKTDIERVSKEEMAEMKKHLKAYKFKYISDEFGSGDWVGVMAQDLEKSKLGRTLVVEDENKFKQIDVRKVMSLFLASLAED